MVRYAHAPTTGGRSALQLFQSTAHHRLCGKDISTSIDTTVSVSLYDKIRFILAVTRITRSENQWGVQGDHGSETFHASKVTVASGLASTANMSVSPGLAMFDTPMIHQKDPGHSSILSDGDLHKVVVLGGGKSSAALVYACVKAGKSVTWIIKKTEGASPGFLLSPEERVRTKVRSQPVRQESPLR